MVWAAKEEVINFAEIIAGCPMCGDSAVTTSLGASLRDQIFRGRERGMELTRYLSKRSMARSIQHLFLESLG